MTVYYRPVVPEARRKKAHGRYVYHDSRSLQFPVRAPKRFLGCLLRPKSLESVLWEPTIGALDQGALGSCTGNAMAHVLAAPAKGRYGPRLPNVDEALAQRIYSAGTFYDDVPGTWPPVDTGSSGLGVIKFAQRSGWVSAYQHAFSLNQTLIALQRTPVLFGLSWREAMYEPDRAGLVSFSGPVVGGHEVALIGCRMEAEQLVFRNSWGPGWGLSGDFVMSFEDFKAALAEDGDVVVPVW